jgi:hypothetical protein
MINRTQAGVAANDAKLYKDKYCMGDGSFVSERFYVIVDFSFRDPSTCKESSWNPSYE